MYSSLFNFVPLVLQRKGSLHVGEVGDRSLLCGKPVLPMKRKRSDEEKTLSNKGQAPPSKRRRQSSEDEVEEMIVSYEGSASPIKRQSTQDEVEDMGISEEGSAPSIKNRNSAQDQSDAMSLSDHKRVMELKGGSYCKFHSSSCFSLC